MRNPKDRGAGPTLVLSIFEGRNLAAVDPEVGSSDPGVLSVFVPLLIILGYNIREWDS
jgi:hypothetical protein